MAKGKKTGGKDFKPGNPIRGGRPKGSGRLAYKLKKRDPEGFRRLVMRFRQMTPSETNAFIASGCATNEELEIIGWIKVSMKGKTDAARLLNDRIYGPVKETMDVNVTGAITSNVHVHSEKIAAVAKTPEGFDILVKLDDAISASKPDSK
jgi:hypothetical protein